MLYIYYITISSGHAWYNSTIYVYTASLNDLTQDFLYALSTKGFTKLYIYT